MHLVIYFCGTSDSGYNFAQNHATYAQELKEHNTQTIIVNGCHHKEVCDSNLKPDLDEFTRRFMTNVFKKNEKGETFLSEPSSEKLAQLKVGIQPPDNRWIYDKELNEIVHVPPDYKCGDFQQLIKKNDDNNFENQNEPIESITFVGFSRGAVTSFNAAKVADKMGIKVPIRIVADQPVPGNLYALPGTNAATIADCSKLKNIETVDLTIAAYTGVTTTEGLAGKLRQLFHRLFFSQIIPKLPTHSENNLSVIPRNNHWEGELSGQQHVDMNLTKQLAKSGLLSQETADKKRDIVTAYYDTHKPLFPDTKDMQRTLGANVGHLYEHIDQHYLDSLKPEEYQEFLCKWWEGQESKASMFSTQLTKDFVSAMRDKNPEKAEEKLINLFTKAEEWLLIKEGTGSSRYHQVMKLRENVRDYLLAHCDNAEEMDDKLGNISRNAMQTTNYFEKQWNRESKAASWFKTDTTRELDKAFKEHAKPDTASKENDEKLLKAMDKWLISKEHSSSSRYELVARMKVQLASAIERYPAETYATRAALR